MVLYTDPLSDSLQGWVPKQTFFADNWEQVPTSLTRYILEKMESEYGNLPALRIRDKNSGEPIQIIGPVDIDGGVTDTRYCYLSFEKDSIKITHVQLRISYSEGEKTESHTSES